MNYPLILQFISYTSGNITASYGRRPGWRRMLRPRLYHPQHEVRGLRPRPGTAHTLLLHRIIALAHPGRIEQRHRIAAELEMHLAHVARRPCVGRHDRGLAPRQAIEQARLAGVRRARDRNREPLAQPLAAMLVGERFLNLVT